jgi:hypothetical protein
MDQNNKIEVTQEPKAVTNEFRGVLELCIFCDIPTTMWHESTNTPCCLECAQTNTLTALHLQRKVKYQADEIHTC